MYTIDSYFNMEYPLISIIRGLRPALYNIDFSTYFPGMNGSTVIVLTALICFMGCLLLYGAPYVSFPIFSDAAIGQTTVHIERHPIYFWIIPAKITGRWSLKIMDAGTTRAATLQLDQRFQEISGTIRFPGDKSNAVSGRITGNQLSFASNDKRHFRFEGKADGPALRGIVQDGPVEKSASELVLRNVIDHLYILQPVPLKEQRAMAEIPLTRLHTPYIIRATADRVRGWRKSSSFKWQFMFHDQESTRRNVGCLDQARR